MLGFILSYISITGAGLLVYNAFSLELDCIYGSNDDIFCVLWLHLWCNFPRKITLYDLPANYDD